MIKLDYQETWYEKAEREELETPSPNEVKAPNMSPEQLFEQALSKVESQSIRQWASSDRNRPYWIGIAESAIAKQDGKPDVFRFAALIVAMGIGL